MLHIAHYWTETKTKFPIYFKCQKLKLKKQLRLTGISLVFPGTVFSQKHWTNQNFDPMMVLDEKSRKHTIYLTLQSFFRGTWISKNQILWQKYQVGTSTKSQGKSVGFILWPSRITICHDYPSRSCWDISFWTKGVDQQADVPWTTLLALPKINTPSSISKGH